MDKDLFYNTLIETLRQKMKHTMAASKDAAEYATNEETRPESKWDTQGLEASYLAAGQAGMAKEWAEAVEELYSERDALLKPNDRISLGAFFKCDFGGEHQYFFFAGVAGGHVVPMGGHQVTVITPQSPIARCLLGLRVDNEFTLPNGKFGKVLVIE